MSFVVKNTTNFGFLDLIAPLTCRGCGELGTLLCDRCKKHNIKTGLEICPRCRKNRESCFCKVPLYAASYREGLIVRLVEEYKYQSIRATSKVLAEIYDQIIPEFSKAVVVPLPTISKHIRERGYDHMKLVAKDFVRLRNKSLRQQDKSSRSNYQFLPILERLNHSVQVGADRAARLTQAKQAYGINQRFLRQLHKKQLADADTTFLLLDDVWTTGASMEAAIAVLERADLVNIAAAVIITGR